MRVDIYATRCVEDPDIVNISRVPTYSVKFLKF